MYFLPRYLFKCRLTFTYSYTFFTFFSHSLQPFCLFLSLQHFFSIPFHTLCLRLYFIPCFSFKCRLVFFFTLSHFFTPTSFIFSFPFPATLFPVTFHTVHVSIFISLPSSSVKCRQTFFLSHQMFTFLHIHSVHTSSPCQILPMPRPLVPPIL